MPDFTYRPTALGEVVSRRQIVSVSTYTGTQLYQFPGNALIDLRWSRDSREVSRCELEVPPTIDADLVPDIVPWLHWVTVWDETGQELYWAGPVQRSSASRSGLSISARDLSALFTRTRCPMTKRWDVTDPADIARELFAAMIEHHGLPARAVARHDPLGDKFDFSVDADQTMLDAVIDQLVGLGLHWTVVGGTPLLGPMPRDIVASLNENDFVGDGLSVVRDGSASFNDVLLRAADNLARAIVPMGGLGLQTVVDVDDMFGVSNADRAVKQYARYVSKIHETISLPDSAVLHPNAPVSISQLIPSRRFLVEARGVMTQMELTGIDVSCTPDTSSVSVRMTTVDDELPELIKIQAADSITGSDDA